MKRILLFVLTVLLYSYSFGNDYLDSLTNLYNSSVKKDTSEGFPSVLMSLSRYYQQHDIKKSREYSKEGLLIANDYNNNQLKYQFNNQTAITFAISGNNDSAEYYFSQFLTLDTSQFTSKNLGSAFNNLGILYSNTGDYEKSLKYHLVGP